MDRLRRPPNVHASLSDYITSSFNAWIRNLLGISSAHGDKIAALESQIARGATFYDNFNRGDSPLLGGGWTQGGTGPGLGIIDFAARLQPSLTAGIEWAIAPVVMEDDNHGVTVIVNPAGVAAGAMSSIFIRSNSDLTEFVYANIYGGACYIGRGTRSGDTWTFNDWDSITTRGVSESDVVELRAVDDDYVLLINNKIVLEHTDVSGYPVNASHRYIAFSQELRFITLIPQYSWGMASFSARAGLVDVGAIEQDAADALSAATSAALDAGTALDAATAAQTTADGLAANVSDAVNAAAAAQATADIAYDYSTYREKEFAVSTSGVNLGDNETTIGILLPVPPGSRIVITRLIYSSESNTGTIEIDFMRKTVGGVESAIHTTNVTSGATTYGDNTIDFEIADLDHFWCRVENMSGVVTALHCCVEYVILPEE